MVPFDATAATLAAAASTCTTTLLPASGVFTFGEMGIPITLAEPLVQAVPCATILPRADHDVPADAQPSAQGGSGEIDDKSLLFETSSSRPSPTVPTPFPANANTAAADKAASSPNLYSPDRHTHYSDFHDPFYISTTPIIYALASCTITAWMLVLVLLMTTRSFFDGGIVYLGRRSGFTSGSPSGVNIGGRPWLQKVAALTVAISLTIATADTLEIAKEQYTWGIQNAGVLQEQVMNRTDLKVIRIISDTFLWLAQAQTLIRLFPRHRERVIIKWVAFALISLDVIFSALNGFVFPKYDIFSNGSQSESSKDFVHPVSAISYVFQLSLGLLYAAWVIYYAILKRRYAFYHPLMKNMPLVAVISLVSITIPIVFFILDISQPIFTAWGDYVRWVGAAAASVVVWEWVERIEALEREEKKDGILGREVFDGDDMLEVYAADYPWHYRKRKELSSGGSGGSGSSGGNDGNDGSGDLGGHHRRMGSGANHPRQSQNGHAQRSSDQRPMAEVGQPPLWPSRPPQAVTPVSRTDSPSAASTVYAIRFQGGSEARTPDQAPYQHTPHDALTRQHSSPRSYSEDGADAGQNHHNRARRSPEYTLDAPTTNEGRSQAGETTRSAARPAAMRSISYSSDVDNPPTAQRAVSKKDFAPRREHGSRWDVKGRLEDFAASQADRFRDRFRPMQETASLPVTVIPAPPRQGAALQQVLEEEEERPGRAEQDQAGQSGDADRLRRFGSHSDGRQPANRSSTGSRPGQIPPDNPPLWPGVRRRMSTFEEEDESFDEDDESSVDDASSVLSGEHGEGTRCTASRP
ncbi:pH-response regulator protein palH/rim21 [Lecanicillium sp. MT-2017a]|nr:pH-response regulator protein palH/rim21 [Lecanicillium sp. MT-2017a]